MLSWLLAFKKPSERFAEDYARRCMEEGRYLSKDASGAMMAAIMAESIKSSDVARYVSAGGTSILLSFELQFLWGVFHEFVQTKPLPTNGYDRILLHTIDWLVNERGYGFEEARHRVLATQSLFNEADPLFDLIAQSGKAFYHQRDTSQFSLALTQISDYRP
ncbi:MAG: hypothetical protein U1E06_07880 [Tabrizicola sp.]|uniref:hypothetical protein n=1 Tax=Tabrizicola sp. TaxID=2005166 RepID=UPI002735DAB8|nr:hypothetical protein [Tabrizicola sp.]MDP3262451.1 hypothetical protein [Tabrizicola sp.]MDP3648529.1 hypothetical protein [Paracoccaceae bacterium]MDZ4066761.1 hypothetical protein [Tabrizicola sp.]